MSYKETVCPRDCYDTCFMKLLLDSDDRPISVVGDKDNLVTHAFLCPRGIMDIKRAYSHERILYPYRRVGDKANDVFERISWDDALDVLVQKLTYVLDAYMQNKNW